MTYDPKVIEALARLRQVASEGRIGMFAGIARDLNALDNAGVFAALDEQTDYAAAEEILAEAAIRETERDAGLDPAEWGDLTRADLASHQRRTTGISGAGKGLTQRQARALFGDTEPIDEPLYGAAADKVRANLENPHSPGCPSIRHRH